MKGSRNCGGPAQQCGGREGREGGRCAKGTKGDISPEQETGSCYVSSTVTLAKLLASLDLCFLIQNLSNTVIVGFMVRRNTTVPTALIILGKIVIVIAMSFLLSL